MTSSPASRPAHSSPPARPWLIVAASFCALFVGTGTVTFMFGVFLQPVTTGLGISRGTYSSGTLLFFILGALTCPFLGKALDLWGSRRVLLPLILAFAGAMAALSRLSPSQPVIFALFALAGSFSAGLMPVAYARSVSLVFDKRRGLALGLAIAGVGCGVALVPPLMGAIIGSAGWRNAFLVYGALVLLFAFLPVALFINDPPIPRERAPGASGLADATGFTAAESFAHWRFWLMLVAFFLAIVAINGTISHMVPLLVDRGLPTGQAVRALSAVGVAAIFSRIACGWLLDRFSGPVVAMVFLAIPIAGIALVSQNGAAQIPWVGALLMGVAIGAEVDILAYFVSRYFGLRAFGAIYGVFFSVFGIGSGVGSFLSGASYDHFKSYDGVFLLYQGLLVISCLLVARLGAYSFGHPRAGARAPATTGQPAH